MPETPEELFARAQDALRMPPVETWETFPFDGALRPLLEPRKHYGEPGELPDELAAELGLMIARVERAIRSIGEIGRVHVCRWGDGGEHLHWWFMARPARLPQLIGSFAAIWADILQPTPEPIWRANVAAVVEALQRQ